MMAARRMSDSLLERLPPVAGRYRAQASLAAMTWFRAGGPAEVLYRPDSADDLARFLAGTPPDIAVTVIGVGSNLLVRDGGIRGVVVRLGRGFASVSVAGTRVLAGAGALDLTVAHMAAETGVGGLEFLSGIPGTIGGAVRMNAGAYGREIKDVLVAAEALDRRGRRHRLSAQELGLGYRSSTVPADWIFVAAELEGVPEPPATIAQRMAEIRAQRAETQPSSRTGGSTFVNPAGVRAWELIERAGCRGLRRGDAAVSDKHCNFLVNLGQATAADIEALGEEVRRRVAAATGVALEWEIKRIGEPEAGR